jgi:elongation factor Ts
LEQPFIRDPSQTVDEMIKGYISTLGENINVVRFVRYKLGEANDDSV